MIPGAVHAGRVLAASSRAVTRGTNEQRCLNLLHRHNGLISSFRNVQSPQARAGVRTMAYVPQVDVTQYEDELLSKVEKVKRLFADRKPLPDVEVCLFSHAAPADSKIQWQ